MKIDLWINYTISFWRKRELKRYSFNYIHSHSKHNLNMWSLSFTELVQTNNCDFLHINVSIFFIQIISWISQNYFMIYTFQVWSVNNKNVNIDYLMSSNWQRSSGISNASWLMHHFSNVTVSLTMNRCVLSTASVNYDRLKNKWTGFDN